MTKDIEASLPALKNRMLTAVTIVGMATLVVTTSGCSISNSISDSVSSPFEWSSDSSKSSSDSKEAAYHGDVRDYTAAYAESSGDVQGFTRNLGLVASKHGITNWEADKTTYTGIGEGLGKAGVDGKMLQAYQATLSGGNVFKAAAIQQGYEKYRNHM